MHVVLYVTCTFWLVDGLTTNWTNINHALHTRRYTLCIHHGMLLCIQSLLYYTLTYVYSLLYYSPSLPVLNMVTWAVITDELITDELITDELTTLTDMTDGLWEEMTDMTDVAEDRDVMIDCLSQTTRNDLSIVNSWIMSVDEPTLTHLNDPTNQHTHAHDSTRSTTTDAPTHV